MALALAIDSLIHEVRFLAVPETTLLGAVGDVKMVGSGPCFKELPIWCYQKTLEEGTLKKKWRLDGYSAGEEFSDSGLFLRK